MLFLFTIFVVMGLHVLKSSLYEASLYYSCKGEKEKGILLKKFIISLTFMYILFCVIILGESAYYILNFIDYSLSNYPH